MLKILRPWTPHATEAMDPQSLKWVVDTLFVKSRGREGATITFPARYGGLEPVPAGVSRRVGRDRRDERANLRVPTESQAACVGGYRGIGPEAEANWLGVNSPTSGGGGGTDGLSSEAGEISVFSLGLSLCLPNKAGKLLEIVIAVRLEEHLSRVRANTAGEGAFYNRCYRSLPSSSGRATRRCGIGGVIGYYHCLQQFALGENRGSPGVLSGASLSARHNSCVCPGPKYHLYRRGRKDDKQYAGNWH